MGKLAVVENIKVTRPDLLPGVEVRTGNSVTEPYPKHWHEEYQLCYLTAGDGYVNYRGEAYATPTSSLYWIAPGEIHSNHTNSSCSFCTVYLDPVVLSRHPLFGEVLELADSLDPIIKNPEILVGFRRFAAALTRQGSVLEQESTLMDLLKSLTGDAKKESGGKILNKETQLLIQIKDYLHENYDRQVSLAELSELTNLSPYYLNRVFSKTVGMPPHAYQMQLRILRAKQLIRNGEPLNSIATSLGFADQSHFIRHFKHLMKITPSLY